MYTFEIINTNPLIASLLISLAINALFFTYAIINKSDKVTDLSYGLSFIVISLISLFRNPNASLFQIVLALSIVFWGVRLISYLLTRILKIKKDNRFDDKRESFVKFGGFFLFQAISVFIIMIPSLLIINKSEVLNFTTLSFIGLAIWAIGLILETVADMQKFKFKNAKENSGKFISTGVWKYSRHPNYFGEMMCWWGLFIYTLPYLNDLELLGIIGPIFISYLLIFVSGIPILEKKYDKRYKDDKSYQEYKNKTSLLVPLPTSE